MMNPVKYQFDGRTQPGSLRRQPLCENRIRRPVTFKDAVGHQHLRCALTFYLLLRLTEGERFRLGKEVRHEQVVMMAEGTQGLTEADKVARDQFGALVNKLVEGVLAVGSRLAKIDGPCLIVDGLACERSTCLPLLSMVNCWR